MAIEVPPRRVPHPTDHVGTPPAKGSRCRGWGPGVVSFLPAVMAPSGSVIVNGKRCLKVLRTLTNLKRRIAAAVLHDKSSKKPVRVSRLSQCPFHLSITSLDRHLDSHSIDTVMTWLDEGSLMQEVSDNRLNERLEQQHTSVDRLP